MRPSVCNALAHSQTHALYDSCFVFQFNSSVPIGKKIPNYNNDPAFGDRMHCVAFVVDASAVSLLPKGIMEKFQTIRSLAQQMGIYFRFTEIEYK